MTIAHARGYAEAAAAEVIAGPSPCCSPPKYSETIAAITAPEDAIFSPVKK